MLWLPHFTALGNQPPVPVADRSAEALELALLEPQPAAAADSLRAALLADPWLCRWMVVMAPDGADTIDALAAWFCAELDELLAQMEQPPEDMQAAQRAFDRPSDSEAERFAIEAAGTLATARQYPAATGGASECPSFLTAMASVDQAVGDPSHPPAPDYLAVCAGLEWRLPRLLALRGRAARTERQFSNQLRQAKLDAMKELAYGASHEVNNPLANISGRAQTLLRDETDHRKRRLLAAIDTQALRAHEMISDLMLFARPPALRCRPTDVGELATSVIDELHELSERQQVELALHQPEQLVTANVDATQCAVAIKALVQNGIEAIGHHGKVVVAVQAFHDAAVVRVSDTGSGITDDVRCHLFDPFFSGREAGRGLGFGLSKCWRIADEHGGSLELESTGSAGSTFALRLPLAAVATSA